MCDFCCRIFCGLKATSLPGTLMGMATTVDHKKETNDGYIKIVFHFKRDRYFILLISLNCNEQIPDKALVTMIY